MNSQQFPTGIGIGWRPELALSIERHNRLGFVEIVAENFSRGAEIPPAVNHLRDRGVPIIPHGVSLSLGGAAVPDPARLEHLARLSELVRAPLISEHLAFVRAGGIEAGHLLPLPRTREALDVVVENILLAKRALPVPLALENIATLFQWPDAEIDEATFLQEVLQRTDTLLLLDISNVYANARNHGNDPLEFLDRIPLDRIAYMHIAGGIERDGLYHDSHAHPVQPAVLNLLEELCARIDPHGVLLERDDDYPSDRELQAELEAIEGAIRRGQKRREVLHVP